MPSAVLAALAVATLFAATGASFAQTRVRTETVRRPAASSQPAIQPSEGPAVTGTVPLRKPLDPARAPAASSVPLPEILRDPSLLPAPVARMRERILAAARFRRPAADRHGHADERDDADLLAQRRQEPDRLLARQFPQLRPASRSCRSSSRSWRRGSSTPTRARRRKCICGPIFTRFRSRRYRRHNASNCSRSSPGPNTKRCAKSGPTISTGSASARMGPGTSWSPAIRARHSGCRSRARRQCLDRYYPTIGLPGQARLDDAERSMRGAAV